MPADLEEKVERYHGLLQRALEKASPSPRDDSHMMRVAEEFKEMAKAYLEDGEHFRDMGDPVNALVCFSYGHAWLDAGARLGVFDVDDEDLFTI